MLAFIEWATVEIWGFDYAPAKFREEITRKGGWALRGDGQHRTQDQPEETMSDDKQTAPLRGLPDGWTVEHRDGYAVLRHPSAMGGYITVDWDCRGFRGGYSTAGRLTSTKTYRGRGWREALVRDAVAWLSSVYDSHPARRQGAR